MGSHKNILKATAWTGSSQVAVLVMGLVRSKVTALLLGPGGVGLNGTYLTITGFIGGIAELGIPQSGVRAVAEARATGDERRVQRMAAALRVAMQVTGMVGMLVALLLAYPVSVMTFGSGERWGELAGLSVTVLLSNYVSGHWAYLQGSQRVREVAQCQVMGTFLGLLAGVVLLYFLGEAGIVAALVANGVAAAVMFRREAHRCGGVGGAVVSWRESLRDAKGLLGLGAAFLFQNLMLGSSGYWSRVMVMGHGGLEALGLYTAAWTLSGYAVQVILAAMGSDFYPRLTAAAGESAVMNRLVNEQIEVGVLLATPALCGMVTLAPVVLGLLFSRDFSGAVPLVQLMSFAASFRVVAWPIGYIMLARSRKGMFMASEAFGAVCGLGLLMVGLRWWGLNGAGVAGAVSAFLFGVFVWGCGRRVTSFRFSRRCLWVVVGHWVVLGMGYGMARAVSGVPGLVAGGVLTAGALMGTLYGLNRMVGFNAWRSLTGRMRRSRDISL